MSTSRTLTTNVPEQPDYKIDPEFESLLPPKTPEQYEELVESIRKDGVRDRLVVWETGGADEEDILIDGHGRHRVCEELGFPSPPIVKMPFANRDAAKEWVLQNQLARRNLTPFQSIEVALKYKELFAARAKANQHAGVSPNLGKGIETNEEVAKLAGVKSPETVRKVERLLEKAGEAKVAKDIDALRSGEDGVSIHSVYQKHCAKPKDANRQPLPPEAPEPPVVEPPPPITNGTDGEEGMANAGTNVPVLPEMESNEVPDTMEPREPELVNPLVATPKEPLTPTDRIFDELREAWESQPQEPDQWAKGVVDAFKELYDAAPSSEYRKILRHQLQQALRSWIDGR